jgi:hypothetical protein
MKELPRWLCCWLAGLPLGISRWWRIQRWLMRDSERLVLQKKASVMSTK